MFICRNLIKILEDFEHKNINFLHVWSLHDEYYSKKYCTEEKSSSFMDSYKNVPVKFASDSGFILCAASVVKHSNSNKIILIWYQNSE
jgi:hypothetical protein